MTARPYIVLDPSRDNVAVAINNLARGTRIGEWGLVLQRRIPKGQRFALRQIPKGEGVQQYGQPFGVSRGIGAGGLVDENAIGSIEFDPASFRWRRPAPQPQPEGFRQRPFKGFLRSDGRVGTRNFYLVVPASQCASDTAMRIAEELARRGLPGKRYPHVDGIAVLPNTEGCGCASNIQLERFMGVLANFVGHPNVGGALVVDLGCEKSNCVALRPKVLSGVRKGLILDFLSIQNLGGTRRTVEAAVRTIAAHLPAVNRSRRSFCPLRSLVLGTECGASDAFSGITANPLIGRVADHVVYAGGSAILSEVPEMVGAEQVLLARARTRAIARKFLSMMRWYQDLARKMNVTLSDNLVSENKNGGLINPTIKSLGAVVKGGTAPIADVLEYGESILRPGLQVMQGPGNDPESVTGVVASGANLICFSTGKGAVSGSPIVPVIKISSTSLLYRRMSGDIDFNAGRLLEGRDDSFRTVADELMDLMTDVASGRRTATELNGQKQFQVWTAGKVSL